MSQGEMLHRQCRRTTTPRKPRPGMSGCQNV